jgi:hypothetical protein
VPEAAVNKDYETSMAEHKIGTTGKVSIVHGPALDSSPDESEAESDLRGAVAFGANPPHPLASLLLAHDIHCRPAPQNNPGKELK